MPYSDKERQKDYQNHWMQNRRIAWIKSQGNKCADCASQDNLEVDHIDRINKEIHASGIWSRKKSVRDLELKKCQVLCKDCHKAKTIRESQVPLMHGTIRMYQLGCRCILCKTEKSNENKRNRK